MGKTYGEQFKEALACQTQEQADKWLEAEVERCRVEFGQDREQATRIIKINLGYMAGYYDDATAKKIHTLFGAGHPIFGGSDYHTTVSPEQAFQAGQHAAKKAIENKAKVG